MLKERLPARISTTGRRPGQAYNPHKYIPKYKHELF